MSRLFEITSCGDPFNRSGWDVREYADSFDEDTCTFRGDISPIQGRDRTIHYLRRNYPNCKIRVQR